MASTVKAVSLTAGIVIGLVTAGYAIYTEIKRRSQQRVVPNEYGIRGTETNNRQCGICLRGIEPSERITLPCSHIFCKRCLGILVSGTQRTCPDCRKELPPSIISKLKSEQLW